jgi:hypothetical protein
VKLSEITGFVKLLLEKRFPDTPEKQKIDHGAEHKLNFACPICGDSQKKISKKRGNLYLDTKHYKCFNDGCMAYMSLTEFVAKMSRRFSILMPSFVLEDTDPTIQNKRVDNQLVRFLTSDTSKLIRITDVINRFSLKRLDSVPEDSVALQFIKRRNLDKIPDYGDFLYTDHSDSRVYIFNFDRQSGKVLGLATRSLRDDVDRKYIIKSYTELSQLFVQKNIEKSLIDDANFLNNYFNILNVSFSEPILLAEGQFDSLLITNCIATSGVSKARSILNNLGSKAGVRIIFDRDKAGKTQMMTLIKQGYSIFLWNKALQQIKRNHSDHQSLIDLQQVKDINDLFSFLVKREPDTTVTSFTKFINGHFSETIFDLVYL